MLTPPQTLQGKTMKMKTLNLQAITNTDACDPTVMASNVSLQLTTCEPDPNILPIQCSLLTILKFDSSEFLLLHSASASSAALGLAHV
jgi:hypothetical protein